MYFELCAGSIIWKLVRKLWMWSYFISSCIRGVFLLRRTSKFLKKSQIWSPPQTMPTSRWKQLRMSIKWRWIWWMSMWIKRSSLLPAKLKWKAIRLILGRLRKPRRCSCIRFLLILWVILQTLCWICFSPRMRPYFIYWISKTERRGSGEFQRQSFISSYTNSVFNLALKMVDEEMMDWEANS